VRIVVRGKTIEQGAATTVWAALNPQFHEKACFFCEDVHVATAADPNETDETRTFTCTGYATWTYDEKAAERLWEESLKMVKLWMQ
jgi:hypothetical protein